MDFWSIINSPIVLTFVTLIWSSIVASRITAIWQKKNHQHELKFQYAKEIIVTYHKYIRFLRVEKKISHGDFHGLHTDLVSQAKIVSHLFNNKEVGEKWSSASDKLANIFNLQSQGRNEGLVEKKMIEVYTDSQHAIKLMFIELEHLPK